MSTPRFDLVDVTQTLRNRRSLLIIVTIIVAIIGAVFHLMGTKEYKAETAFLMTNPMYTDRNNLFQDRQIQFVDYFAGDNDVDRLVSLAEADTIKYLVSQRLNLAAAYQLDASNPKDLLKLKNIFKGNYKLDRTEYNNCSLSYTDTDPVRAAAVANECVKAIEEIFRGYYIGQRSKIIGAFQSKLSVMDSLVSFYTDSLASMRDRYKIYDIMNPTRENLVTPSIKSNGSVDFGKAMETVQNIESIKDQMVADRARYSSLLNQYLTTTQASDNPVIHVLTSAHVPAKPKGLGLILTTIASAMVGFFFCSLYVLITTYYRLLIAVER